jgi:hypothetical protein
VSHPQQGNPSLQQRPRAPIAKTDTPHSISSYFYDRLLRNVSEYHKLRWAMCALLYITQSHDGACGPTGLLAPTGLHSCTVAAEHPGA